MMFLIPAWHLPLYISLLDKALLFDVTPGPRLFLCLRRDIAEVVLVLVFEPWDHIFSLASDDCGPPWHPAQVTKLPNTRDRSWTTSNGSKVLCSTYCLGVIDMKGHGHKGSWIIMDINGHVSWRNIGIKRHGNEGKWTWRDMDIKGHVLWRNMVMKGPERTWSWSNMDSKDMCYLQY